MKQLSKSKYAKYCQCPKCLWMSAYKPEEEVIDPTAEGRFEKGTEVGNLAKGILGDYVDVTTRKEDGGLDLAAMLQKTQENITSGAENICEAAFSKDGNYCAVDILRKTDSGYDSYEVKNSPEVHDQFIKDCGFQNYILSRCKITVGNIYVVTHGDNENNPYVINDVTSGAKELYNWVNDNIWNLNKMQKSPEEINVTTGDQCCNPYECWYYGYCHEQ